jgi:hypothetical protein
MGEAEQRDLIAQYVAAYNRFDVDGMVALLTDDVRFENVASGRVTAAAAGAAEFRALAERAVGRRFISICTLNPTSRLPTEAEMASMQKFIAHRQVSGPDIG